MTSTGVRRGRDLNIMRATCAVVIALLLLSACADRGPSRVETRVDSAGGEVAFELSGAGGAVLTVPVQLNGQGPYQFVVDTGATITCLNTPLAAQLDLPPVRGVVGTGAGVGGRGQLQLVEIDSLQIGGVIAHELQACVVDLQHLEGMGLELDGLLGLNVLKEFHVTFDFERNVLTLAEPQRR